MICLPWTAATRPPDPDAACTVFAARLPLRSRRALPCALRHALRVRHALRGEDGVVGHTMGIEVATATLWTVSAWTYRTDLAGFDRSPAHRAAKDRLRADLQPSTFAVWRCRARDLPTRWPEIRHRLLTTTRTEPSS